MQTHRFIKFILPIAWLILVSACQTSPEELTVMSAAENSANAILQSNSAEEPSPWQLAYGEKRDPTVNELDPVSQSVDEDLWQRIRDGFVISDYEHIHPKTQQQLDKFNKHPDQLGRVVERARPYLFYIVEQLEARDMPLELALLPVVESSYKPFSYSHGRASGLWQFIPSTGKMYGLKQNWWYDGRRDVIASTRAAIDYLEKLYNDFDDWQLALAAYNCGEGNVRRAIKNNKRVGKKTDFWSLKLPKETSFYVPKLMAISHLVKDPQRFQVELSPVENSAYLEVVDVGSQIDLALAARLAGIQTDEIYLLNPGFNHWATDPQGPHQLLIPKEKAAHFKQELAKLPAEKRIQWARYKVKSGESLGQIAQDYQTRIAVIKDVNHLSSNTIRAGQHLLIPVASGERSDYALTESQRLAVLTDRPSQTSRKIIYTVRQGDSWWEIAKKYGVHVNTLTKWNGKAPGDVLSKGQKLVIWQQQADTSLLGKVKTVYYTIKDGDSLWEIARKFKVSVPQVRAWNDMNEFTLIQPGQSLTLYVDIIRQYDQI